MDTTLPPASYLARKQVDIQMEIDRILSSLGMDPDKVKFPVPPVCTLYWNACDWVNYMLHPDRYPAQREEAKKRGVIPA